MNMDHQQDDTGGLLAGLISLIGIVGFVTFITWLFHTPTP